MARGSISLGILAIGISPSPCNMWQILEFIALLQPVINDYWEPYCFSHSVPSALEIKPSFSLLCLCPGQFQALTTDCILCEKLTTLFYACQASSTNKNPACRDFFCLAQIPLIVNFTSVGAVAGEVLERGFSRLALYIDNWAWLEQGAAGLSGQPLQQKVAQLLSCVSTFDIRGAKGFISFFLNVFLVHMKMFLYVNQTTLWD